MRLFEIHMDLAILHKKEAVFYIIGISIIEMLSMIFIMV